jgi:hypothetical protein
LPGLFCRQQGGLLIDGQVRWTFFQNDVSDSNHGMSVQRFDARSVSVTGNIGYNHNLGNQWFVEPSAGFIWSRTQVDTMNVPGTLVYGFGGVPPWTLAVNDIDSMLGRLSVRVGTTVAYDNVVLQPFASASVFHEFQGRVTSTLTSDFAAIGMSAPTLSSTVSVSSPGTYGQFGLGVAAQVLNSGWVSYLRGDYRTGENIEGWSVNGGLRYQFTPERPGMITKAPVYKSSRQRDRVQLGRLLCWRASSATSRTRSLGARWMRLVSARCRPARRRRDRIPTIKSDAGSLDFRRLELEQCQGARPAPTASSTAARASSTFSDHNRPDRLRLLGQAAGVRQGRPRHRTRAQSV